MSPRPATRPGGGLRSARRWLLALALLGLAGCADWWRPPTNLLLICIDTVRADLFNHPDIEDALSPWLASAQRFDNATTVAPWTLPTVATVFTGLRPPEHGAGDFPGPVHDLSRDRPTVLAEEAVTLAEHLAAGGYATAVFSAHPWLKTGFGLDQGFARREYYRGGENLVRLLFDWIANPQREDEPYFAYLHLMEPHDRHRAEAEEIRERVRSQPATRRAFLEANRMPGVCRGRPSLRCLRSQAYQIAVLDARATLAGILDRLDASGELDNTLVVVYSDHGEAFRERRDQHRRLQEDPRGMYGTGHGQYLFQELLAVPLLAWVPGQPGARHPQRVSLADLFPSVLDWLGQPAPAGFTPTGLLPGTGDGDGLASRPVYASHIAYGPETLAVIDGDAKAMYWPDEDRYLFFDLASDPQERQPLADPAWRTGFDTLAGDYLALQPRFLAAPAEPDADALRDLQAIGYLQGATEPGARPAAGQTAPDPLTDEDRE